MLIKIYFIVFLKEKKNTLKKSIKNDFGNGSDHSGFQPVYKHNGKTT